MIRQPLAIVFAIIATLAALSPPAQSQTFPQSTVLKEMARSSDPALRTPATPKGRPDAATDGKGGSGFSALTTEECRKLGGKTEIDDGGSCKLRTRCAITHGNGDVYSSCIDEAN